MSKLPLSYNPYRFMQQALLMDRFKLKVHFETKELPIYVLVVAKGGPKLKASEMNPAEARGIKSPLGQGRRRPQSGGWRDRLARGPLENTANSQPLRDSSLARGS